MRVWIDLANSPQVLFFAPLIKRLEYVGHTVLITTRPFAQTVPLADQFGLRHTPIGRHGGKRKVDLIWHNLDRARALVQWARHQYVELVVSHNSYGQAIAAWLARLPFVTLMDYEHQPGNHLCFRLARRVIVPEVFPDEFCKKYGAHGKTLRYPGLKEQVYLSDYQPVVGWRTLHGLPEDKVLAVVRPPGTWGFYSKAENPLFSQVFSHVVQHKDVFIVFLPRVPEQRAVVKSGRWPNVHVPDTVLDGAHLQHAADLVISGGGTMNREAAVLGTPAYSIFNGKIPAVDRYLEERGRLRLISNEQQLSLIRLEQKPSSLGLMRQPALVPEIVRLIESAVSDS